MAKESDTTPAATKPTAATGTTTVQAAGGDSSVPLVSMLLGIISLATFMWFLGIPALVLGIIGLKKTSQNRGFSMTGIITGAISTLFMICSIFLLVFLILLGAFASSTDTETVPGDSAPYQYQYPEGNGFRFRGTQEGA